MDYVTETSYITHEEWIPSYTKYEHLNENDCNYAVNDNDYNSSLEVKNYDYEVEMYDMDVGDKIEEMEESLYEICWNVGDDPKTVLAEFKHCVSYEDLHNKVELEYIFSMSSNGNMFSIDSELLDAGLVAFRKPQN
jgi:hypothetical protein